MSSESNLLDSLKKVINIEKMALDKLIDSVGNDYIKAIEIIENRRGKIIFMGLGKSGIIAKKLAATFSSTGTPSFFIHATEGVHGDLGMIDEGDVVVMMSNSGNTTELVSNLPSLKKIGCKIIAISGNSDSKIVKESDCAIVYPIENEADHLNLAPTVSTTLMLVLGDAIACVLSERLNFKKENFKLYHPGGAIGQKLSEE